MPNENQIDIDASKAIKEMDKLSKSTEATTNKFAGSNDSLEKNIGAVGLAAKINIAGHVMNAIQMVARPFQHLKGVMLNTEKQIIRLGTAFQSEAKGFQEFDKAMRKAASTPFDLQDVLHSVVQLKGYGEDALGIVKDTKGKVITNMKGDAVQLIDVLGNVAGATGRGLGRTMEAYADAIMGEWERLKEFGIKKSMVPALNGLTAGTKKYTDTLNEFLATSNRFKGGMAKMATSIGGMASNLGDLFTRLSIDITGAADSLLRMQDTKIISGSLGISVDKKTGKKTIKDFEAMYMSIAEVQKKYKLGKDDSKLLDGLEVGTKKYGAALRDVLKTNKEFNREVITIKKANTLYDAVRLSVRELYDAFEEAGDGFHLIGIAIGQFLMHIWKGVIYPIFKWIGEGFNAIGQYMMDFVIGLDDSIAKLEKPLDRMNAYVKRLTEVIAINWLWFKMFVLEPIIDVFLEVSKAVGKMASSVGLDFEGIIIAMTALWVFGKIKLLATAFMAVVKSVNLLKFAMKALSSVGLMLLIANISKLILHWDGLEEKGELMKTFMLALAGGAMILLPWLIGLAGGLGAATAATWAFTVALLANPITWIVLAVMALIAALVLVVVYWDEIEAAIIEGIDWLIAKWDEFTTWISEMWAEIVNGVQRDWDNLMSSLSSGWDSLWEGIKDVAVTAGKWVMGIIDSMVGGLKDAVGWVANLFSSDKSDSKITKKFETKNEAIFNQEGTAEDAIRGSTKAIGNTFDRSLGKLKLPTPVANVTVINKTDNTGVNTSNGSVYPAPSSGFNFPSLNPYTSMPIGSTP